MLIIQTDDKCLDKYTLFLYNSNITNIKYYADWITFCIFLYAHTIKLLVLIMEKTKKMGDGVCCPVGEECPPEPPKAEDITGTVKQYVNPYAIPYVQSDHLKKLIKKKEALDQKQRPPKI